MARIYHWWVIRIVDRRQFDSRLLVDGSPERHDEGRQRPVNLSKVRHVHVDTCSNRSTDLYRPSETYFDWASVNTYSDRSTDPCRPSEEDFD
ncbi:hypothetical protein QJS10_CPB18g00665 [Acorus calamus]|uniref:Uncharacterized protein n=1 Tax=Acorus calamus TaxID=4465 RepID=A0AAV9CR61_ACOCL|nr:hypothetical protein QJS10_CPB18g00665 [Acorus calamus]